MPGLLSGWLPHPRLRRPSILHAPGRQKHAGSERFRVLHDELDGAAIAIVVLDQPISQARARLGFLFPPAADVQAARSRQWSRCDYPHRPIRLPGARATGFLRTVAPLARLSPQADRDQRVAAFGPLRQAKRRSATMRASGSAVFAHVSHTSPAFRPCNGTGSLSVSDKKAHPTTTERLHETRDARCPRRLYAGSHHPLLGGADLPDGGLRVRQRAARRGPVVIQLVV